MHSTSLTHSALDPNWVLVQTALGSLCNSWAGRRDVTVSMGQGKGTSSFRWDTAQIEINREQAFGSTDPASIGDLRDRQVLSQYPIAGGVAFHEAMHARYRTTDPAALKARARDIGGNSMLNVLIHLEETRIEGRGIHAWPKDRGYLRAMARTLFMDEETENWSPRMVALLIMGRVAVGVFTRQEVKVAETFLLTQPGWSAELINRVMAAVSQFRDLDDSGPDQEAQLTLAREVDEMMPKDPEPESSDSEDGEGDLSDVIKAILAALGAVERAGISETAEVAAESAAEDAARERQQEREAKAQNEKKADDVFRMPSGQGPSAIPEQLNNGRMPTGDERAAAVKLARALDNAKYRDRVVTDFRSALPPGRFHGGEAMRLDAAREMGGPISGYRPFRRRKHQHVDEPPLTVGVMCDVSGSMSRVQPAVGVASWVLSEAVSRVSEATAAQVYYGHKVYPGFRKGERLMKVPTWQGAAAWEEFDGGFRALDGELNLLAGSGARLLVVVSDGGYRPVQIAATDRWLKACVKSGVGVLWLGLYGDDRGKQFCEDAGKGAHHLKIGTDLLGAIDAIGAAAVKALADVNSGG